jgi:isoleucyl-tRNA synthetase
MDALVTLGRNHREKIKVKAKIPLLTMKVIHREKRVLENLERFETYFKDELNIRSIEYIADEDSFVAISAKANFPVLGKRVGPKMKQIAASIQKMGLEGILKLEKGEALSLEGEEITFADVEIRRAPKGDNPNLAVDSLVSIEIDPTVTAEQEEEGNLRTLTRAVNQKRKIENLNLDDRIAVTLPASFKSIIERDVAFFKSETLSESLAYDESKVANFEELEVDSIVPLLGIQVIR